MIPKEPVSQAKFIDSCNLSPLHYQLMMSDFIIQRTGNDAYYRLPSISHLRAATVHPEDNPYYSWEDLMLRARGCVLHAIQYRQEIKDGDSIFLNFPLPSFEEARDSFVSWLESSGIVEDDIVIIKIWW